MTIRQYLPAWAASGTPRDDSPEEEELLGWTGPTNYETRPTERPQRLPRLRKVSLYLLLIDLVLVVVLVYTLEPLITLLTRNEELFGARVSLSQDPAWAPENQFENRHKIPRILHQTTPNDTIPDKWVDSQQSCIEAYSDFEYKLWTDDRARDFIASKYSWFLNVWDNYDFVIQRADSIRYFVLHHYGGIYLDMDTVCNASFPLEQVEADTAGHHAIFKSTLPTGVTNDFMISSARHPAFTSVISRLPYFYALTHFWARFIPYAAIMISSGPFFLSWIIKSYLEEQDALPTTTIKIINDTELTPYITDLQSCTWHKGDAQAIMWLGNHPWSWFALGAMGLVLALYLLNHLLLMAYRAILRKASSVNYNLKMAKLT